MTMLEIPLGTAWSDRFHQPSLDTLIEDLGDDLAVPFQTVREELLERALSEDLAWNGPTYQWSLGYSGPKAERPSFFLVPRPTHPILAAPVSLERLAEIDTKALDRSFRERIIAASVVGPNAWCTWSIQSKTGAASIVSGLRTLLDSPA
ncbi:MAG: hypothetical protein ACF8Q5_04395 [Phycisphaerales bacterium JB040]